MVVWIQGLQLAIPGQACIVQLQTHGLLDLAQVQHVVMVFANNVMVLAVALTKQEYLMVTAVRVQILIVVLVFA